MSLQKKIELKIRGIIEFNRIPILKFVVKEEKVLHERKYKRENVYKVKIIFSKKKNPLDYFVVLSNYFVFRFKVYRTHYDNSDNSLNYYLKLRDINAIKSILEE